MQCLSFYGEKLSSQPKQKLLSSKSANLICKAPIIFKHCDQWNLSIMDSSGSIFLFAIQKFSFLRDKNVLRWTCQDQNSSSLVQRFPWSHLLYYCITALQCPALKVCSNMCCSLREAPSTVAVMPHAKPLTCSIQVDI